MRRLVLAIIALGACAATAAAADPPARQPVRIDSVWLHPGRRTVHVQLARSMCTRDLRLSVLQQGARTVRIGFDETPADPGTVCVAALKLECWAVVLERPLRGRRVVDGNSARVLRGAPRGLPAPSPCPRAVPAKP